jgi:hypothetical protein
MEKIRKSGYVIVKENEEDVGKSFLNDKDIPVKQKDFLEFKKNTNDAIKGIKMQLGRIEKKIKDKS